MEYNITIDTIPATIASIVNDYELRHVDIELVVRKIESGLAERMEREAFVKYCSEVAASMITKHFEYDKLAAVLIMSYYASKIPGTFSQKIQNVQYHNGNLNKELYDMVMRNAEQYDSIIDYSRDFGLSYFAIISLTKSYILKIGKGFAERPQDMYLRVAVQIHRDDFERVKETYDLLSMGYFTHATPTLFNSMLLNCQMASCFLTTTKGDNISDIFESIKDCAMISKHSGGLGMSLHDIRCAGSALASTGGVSKGIVPIIRIINETMKYVNQGGIKRQSSIAFYIEPWHMDILSFLDLRKNSGNEEFRAREIFTAIWMNDLFMERVKSNGDWSLFDPNVAPGLGDVWGEDFKRLYCKYEKTKSRKVLKAQDLWKAILVAQIETGTPYIVYKDTANKNSNQKNLGTIKSSNLCAEIIEYSSRDEIAVCNLASICLPRFVVDGTFDFFALKSATKVVANNLDIVIDCNFYPIEETRKSNMSHRPMGIGVQGLADVFAMLRYPFESSSARKLNSMIFETMYYAAIEASVERAMQMGTYSSFAGSPLSQGVFHFEMMGIAPSGIWDWEELRAKVLKYGVRNSLFIALMPTAGTSQIFGNNECIEPFTSNVYTRRTIAGEFQIINKHLMKDLLKLNLWSEDMRQLLIDFEGSIQNIPLIPADIKELYKTVWEIKMKSIVEMAADRQAFIDQSQSMNIYFAQPTYQQLSSMHFYGWKLGLKTGIYYLRTKPIGSAIKFTVDQELVKRTLSSLQESEKNKSNENEDNGCASCSC
ncbi:ribonucleoside-diphosphate reductase subunit M1 [Enteropsectra breve]|nr:ribonucleoside-diphosphate reductase subunit M1 [Enteropsectra breve]